MLAPRWRARVRSRSCSTPPSRQRSAREGLAREFISIAQQARKNAAFEVYDRFRVAFHVDDAELAEALIEHASTIASEILASAFAASGSLGAGAQRVEVNGRALSWEMAKA